MKNTSKPTKSKRQRLINRKREINGNATNHKRTKTSNQTEGHRHNNQQTNANQHKKLKNLEPIYKSNPKQQTEQRQIWTINTTQQKNECKAKRKSKTNTSKPTNHQQQSNSLENYKTTHNPGISRHQPSVVCWTSWPAQPGQDGREFRQPGGAQKRVTHPGEAEDS